MKIPMVAKTSWGIDVVEVGGGGVGPETKNETVSQSYGPQISVSTPHGG